jgi:hypothetical protein
VFAEETNVQEVAGHEDTRDSRGDRYWMKKNAAATATLIVKLQTILDYALRKPTMADPKDPVPGEKEEETEPAASMAASAMARRRRSSSASAAAGSTRKK